MLDDGEVRNLRKAACNSLVGMWGKRQHHRLRATCSATWGDEDLLCGGFGETMRRRVGVGDWCDMFHKQHLVRRHTYYLLHRAVLCAEACLLAHMLLASLVAPRSWRT